MPHWSPSRRSRPVRFFCTGFAIPLGLGHGEHRVQLYCQKSSCSIFLKKKTKKVGGFQGTARNPEFPLVQIVPNCGTCGTSILGAGIADPYSFSLAWDKFPCNFLVPNGEILRLDGRYIKVPRGIFLVCPVAFPRKGNNNFHVYHTRGINTHSVFVDFPDFPPAFLSAGVGTFPSLWAFGEKYVGIVPLAGNPRNCGIGSSKIPLLVTLRGVGEVVKASTRDGGFPRFGFRVKPQNVVSVVGVFPTGHRSFSFSGLSVPAARKLRGSLNCKIFFGTIQGTKQIFFRKGVSPVFLLGFSFLGNQPQGGVFTPRASTPTTTNIYLLITSDI